MALELYENVIVNVDYHDTPTANPPSCEILGVTFHCRHVKARRTVHVCSARHNSIEFSTT
jgi:hypothetical protein